MKIQYLAPLVAALCFDGCVMQSTFDREHQLNETLQSEVQSDQVEIHQLKDRLRITIEDSLLYPSGQAALSGSGKKALDQLLPALKDADADHRIEVEGYTDSVPVGHHLKGNGQSYGFAVVTRIGRELEAAALQRDALRVTALAEELSAWERSVRWTAVAVA